MTSRPRIDTETAPQAFSRNAQAIPKLFAIIADSLDHDAQRANWGHVGDIANAREMLMELAIAVSGHMDEALARADIEQQIAGMGDVFLDRR